MRTNNETQRVRNDWQVDEVSKIYHTRLLNLIFQAASVHHQFHKPEDIQQCTLLSIKTGACPEDCAYCPQSSRYKTGVQPEPLLSIDSVMEKARTAREAGSTRFCMGAAWREVKDDAAFEQVLAMVEGVASLSLEVCCTLGMLTLEQAQRLKKAGVYAYNHNLDTGKGYYGEIITTRQYQDRLDTLKNVRHAGMTVCCGGIIGMGESHSDRIDLLHTLASMEEHPESVPINALVAVEGTPLAGEPPVAPFELMRMIATARILMPRAKVRLSAGRAALSIAEQALCFLAGANSIFTGDKLLTTPNCDFDEDRNMLELLGLEAESNALLLQ
jgi:biotin synthase